MSSQLTSDGNGGHIAQVYPNLFTHFTGKSMERNASNSFHASSPCLLDTDTQQRNVSSASKQKKRIHFLKSQPTGSSSSALEVTTVEGVELRKKLENLFKNGNLSQYRLA